MSEGSFEGGGIEWRAEYRDDDIVDEGFCPECGAPLTNITVGGQGFCDTHKMVFAEWTRPKEADEGGET